MQSAAKVRAVVFDLDGVLVDTQRLFHTVTNAVLAKHFGKQELSPEVSAEALGLAPKEAIAVVIDRLGLDTTVEDYLQLQAPFLAEGWSTVSLLPGAERLVRHLKRTGVPIAIGTSSDRESLQRKMQANRSLFEEFGTRIVTSDDVARGKPAPDIFLRACELLPGVKASECLVVEDSPAGIMAAHAANMQTLLLVSDMVPADAYDAAVPHLRMTSLLEFDPSLLGLPPFTDLIQHTVPMPPLRLQGEVIRGFGRGSRELGIPTANLPASAFSQLLHNSTCGIYHGFAQVDDGPVHKMVTSIGRNPYYGNRDKTIEPHILHTFPEDFYGANMRLVITGFIRPEANFPSLEALIEAIHGDIECAKRALDEPVFLQYSHDAFFANAAVGAPRTNDSDGMPQWLQRTLPTGPPSCEP